MFGSRKRPRDNSGDCMRLTAFFKRYSHCRYTLYINIILQMKPFRVEREDPTDSDTELVSGNDDECTSISGASPSTEMACDSDPGMSRDSSTSSPSQPPLTPSTTLEGQIDLGEIVIV